MKGIGSQKAGGPRLREANVVVATVVRATRPSRAEACCSASSCRCLCNLSRFYMADKPLIEPIFPHHWWHRHCSNARVFMGCGLIRIVCKSQKGPSSAVAPISGVYTPISRRCLFFSRACHRSCVWLVVDVRRCASDSAAGRRFGGSCDSGAFTQPPQGQSWFSEKGRVSPRLVLLYLFAPPRRFQHVSIFRR